MSNDENPLKVTRGDGVPLPDQAAALEEFKRQSRKPGATNSRGAQAMTDPAALKPCAHCGERPRRGLKMRGQDMSNMIFCDTCQYWLYEVTWNRRATAAPVLAVGEQTAATRPPTPEGMIKICPQNGRACEYTGCVGLHCALQPSPATNALTYTGWTCPQCGTSYAPWVQSCGCKPLGYVRTTTEIRS